MPTSNASSIIFQENSISFEFHLHPESELVSDIIRERGHYSRNDLEIMRRLIRPGDFVVDVGANIGWYTLFFSAWVGEGGKVLAIEPDRGNISILRRNVEGAKYGNTEVADIALGEKSSSGFLFRSKVNSGDHSLGRMSETQEKSKIRIESLDRLLEGPPGERMPDFIKIDAQGSEPRILRGSRVFFEKYRPVMMIEYSPSHIYRCNASPFELFAFIENHHYVPFRQLGDGEEVSPGKTLEFLTPDTLFHYHRYLLATGFGIDILLLPPDRMSDISDSVYNLV